MIGILLVASTLAAPQYEQLYEYGPPQDEYSPPHHDYGVPHSDYGVPHSDYGVPREASTTEQ